MTDKAEEHEITMLSDFEKIESEMHPLVALPDDANLPALTHPGLHRYLQEISRYKLLTREETE